MEGDDYIPAAFDSWVSDGDCRFMGMWKDEALVGGLTSASSPTVGWLEGMRIARVSGRDTAENWP